MRIALAILLATLAILARADGIYKWVDDKGVVHFGSQPPLEKKEVEVVREPKSKRLKQWQAQQAALKAAAKPAAAEKTAAVTTESQQQQQQRQPEENKALSQAQRAVRAQRCRMARSNLRELTTHSRVRELGRDGRMRVLPEEERQARITRERQTARDNC